MVKSKKRYSSAHIASQSSKTQKYRRYQSVTSLDETITNKEKKIRENFRRMIRRLMAKQGQDKQIYIISFLNIMASCEDVCSLVYLPYIPSIENMMSHHLINPNQEYQCSQDQSFFSFTQPISSSLLQAQPQIPVYFMCLLERVMKLISSPLTKDQNQSVIKGTWNILIKYWKDNGHRLYKVNQKVEWGLLQLLSFNFGANKKERFDAEQRLRMTLNNVQFNQQNQNSRNQQESQRNYFCTLQYIEQSCFNFIKNEQIYQQK